MRVIDRTVSFTRDDKQHVGRLHAVGLPGHWLATIYVNDGLYMTGEQHMSGGDRMDRMDDEEFFVAIRGKLAWHFGVFIDHDEEGTDWVRPMARDIEDFKPTPPVPNNLRIIDHYVDARRGPIKGIGRLHIVLLPNDWYSVLHADQKFLSISGDKRATLDCDFNDDVSVTQAIGRRYLNDADIIISNFETGTLQ